MKSIPRKDRPSVVHFIVAPRKRTSVCGERTNSHNVMTVGVDEVSCKRCLKTELYLEAATKPQDFLKTAHMRLAMRRTSLRRAREKVEHYQQRIRDIEQGIEEAKAEVRKLDPRRDLIGNWPLPRVRDQLEGPEVEHHQL